MENLYGNCYLEINFENRTINDKVLLWGFEPQSRA